MKTGETLAAAPPPPRPPAHSAKAIVGVQDVLVHASETDEEGNVMHCPEGTVPERRVTAEELSHFPTVDSFVHWKSNKNLPVPGGEFRDSVRVPQPDGIIRPMDFYLGEDTATQVQTQLNWGMQSTINLWNFYTAGPDDFSLSQTWVVNFTGGTGHIETAELGLMTYQYITSNPNAVLFVYWTNDSYQQGEACGYDGQCGNFTQTNGNIYVGGGFSEYSQWGGAQYEVALQTEVYEGNVWLAYEGTWFGYFPGSNYSYLNQNSDQIEWGGQVNNSGTDDYPDATQMGSGAYPSGNDGYGFVAYQLHSQWLTFSYEYIDTAGSADTNYPGCYQEIPWTADGNLGSSMFLGGIAYPGCAN